MLTPRPRPRKDGSVGWQVPFHYYDTHGRRRQSSETFDDYGEAVSWADLIARVGLDEALRAIGTEPGADAGMVLLVDWLERYADQLTGIQEDVRRKYQSYIRNDIAPYFGVCVAIDAVTREADAAWVIYLKQVKGNAPKTIKNKHGFLSAALRAAVELRLLEFNPCAQTRLPTEVFD